MTYEKTEWKDGDIITAEKLNHLEDAVSESWAGDNSFPVYLEAEYSEKESNQTWYNVKSFSKTASEIMSAYNENKHVFFIVKYSDNNVPPGTITKVKLEPDLYYDYSYMNGPYLIARSVSISDGAQAGIVLDNYVLTVNSNRTDSSDSDFVFHRMTIYATAKQNS